jgi:hypothetical protein
VDEAQLQARLDELFDSELVFHSYANYMRDYELVVYQSVDPRSGLAPRHLRNLFRLCTEADVRSTVLPAVWTRSTDDELLDSHHVTREAPGYVWGVRCQGLYPGATIVDGSARAQVWTNQLGIPFHEVQIEANAHAITLVFADLSVEEVGAGYGPYHVEIKGIAETYADGSKMPLRPSDP